MYIHRPRYEMSRHGHVRDRDDLHRQHSLHRIRIVRLHVRENVHGHDLRDISNARLVIASMVECYGYIPWL